MNILIATGIYPPRVGGPAQYAKNLEEVWKKEGHTVTIKTYDKEYDLPTGIRHLYYFFKILPTVINSDFVLALDTFSVGLPAVCATRLVGVPCIIRTGGDFLWESYVERTHDLVFFKDFYETRLSNLNVKEKIILYATKFTLTLARQVVFSTEWQRNPWVKAYGIHTAKINIVENFYGTKIPSLPPSKKVFLGSTRPLVWKNIETLAYVFEDIQDVELITKPLPYETMMKTMDECYAVILVSLGDISPNMILDAIARNKPFILTKENGITERIKEYAIFVDPSNPADIKEKVLWLCDQKNYDEQKKKIEAFTFTHSWEEIAHEIKTLV